MDKNTLFGSGTYLLGVLSIILAFFNPLEGVALGISSLLIERTEKNDFSKKGRKLGKIGIILGIVFTIIIQIIINSYTPLPI